jgi:hypothetical protein
MTIKGDQLSYDVRPLLTGSVEANGTVKAYSGNHGVMLTGQIQGSQFVGKLLRGNCRLDLYFQKQP